MEMTDVIATGYYSYKRRETSEPLRNAFADLGSSVQNLTSVNSKIGYKKTMENVLWYKKVEHSVDAWEMKSSRSIISPIH